MYQRRDDVAKHFSLLVGKDYGLALTNCYTWRNLAMIKLGIIEKNKEEFKKRTGSYDAWVPVQ